jgi:peptidoglycan lytic transglycosylase F
MNRIKQILTIACVVLVVACDPSDKAQKPSRSLAQIKQSGVLVVLTRNAPTTWYIGRDEERTGPEHDMVEAFAAHLGVKVEYKIKETIKSIIEGIEQGEGDLAAAGLTITEDRKARFRFGPPYQDVTEQIVCRRDNVQPEKIDDLIGLNIQVIAASSYVEHLRALREKYPKLAWTETDQEDTERLLYDVWRRKIDCTVADSTIVDINRRYFPELIAPLNLAKAESLGWMMPYDRSDLQGAIKDWFDDYRQSGRLAQLQERYYGYFEVFDYVDIKKYINRIDTRFPTYRTYFKQAADQHNLPYTLLAAQGYQESHWRANASSPTGVRGIMMLTQPTARAMGVTNRLDPKQSIFGGAKYLARIKGRLPDQIKDPDRTWLALAAYNVGYAHLRDAQELARQQGRNPNLWSDVNDILPLLSDKHYYTKLEYGYARGTEPVRYVQRIREYRLVLEEKLK